MLYPKPAKTPQQHIALLESRNMQFADKKSAEIFLKHISYYHLGLYWHDMREAACSDDKRGIFRKEEFAENTKFEEIVRLYNFDEKLRALIAGALEKIELSLKTQWAQYFSLKYNPLFYCDAGFYNQNPLEGKIIQDIIQNAELKFSRSKEDFIQKYKSRRPQVSLPEAWVITELLTFGEFLYFVRFLKPKHKNALSGLYAENKGSDFLSEADFIILLRQMRVVRNICAHNDRLWNRSFPFAPSQPEHSPLLRQSLNPAARHKIYNILCYISYFLRNIGGGESWRDEVKSLMDSHADYARRMGFRPDWRSAHLWIQHRPASGSF